MTKYLDETGLQHLVKKLNSGDSSQPNKKIIILTSGNLYENDRVGKPFVKLSEGEWSDSPNVGDLVILCNGDSQTYAGIPDISVSYSHGDVYKIVEIKMHPDNSNVKIVVFESLPITNIVGSIKPKLLWSGNWSGTSPINVDITKYTILMVGTTINGVKNKKRTLLIKSSETEEWHSDSQRVAGLAPVYFIGIRRVSLEDDRISGSAYGKYAIGSMSYGGGNTQSAGYNITKIYGLI